MEPTVLTFTKAQLEKARSKRITLATVAMVFLSFSIILSVACIATGILFELITGGRTERRPDDIALDNRTEKTIKAGYALLVVGFVAVIAFSVLVRMRVVFRRKLRALDTPPEFILAKEARKRLKAQGIITKNFVVIVALDDAPTADTS
ncbi:hypothetical protein DL89DRAFT_266713 [Linderina pennispora]|uniref:Uncharacterized protein n=1 Tax=Linderina pennispora TaxID=61395 RepID=A0A1Y1WAC0_9FUNG|nr:uncharacterized protein DL89DRAFT_266713 [Linderina pennispora]ORX70500.1 hypothetical protein DL89DRAFT_266713 [Linderina pennispora]